MSCRVPQGDSQLRSCFSASSGWSWPVQTRLQVGTNPRRYRRGAIPVTRSAIRCPDGGVALSSAASGRRITGSTTARPSDCSASPCKAEVPVAVGRSHGCPRLRLTAATRSWTQRLVIRGRKREFGLGSIVPASLAKASEPALEERFRAVRKGWLGAIVRHIWRTTASAGIIVLLVDGETSSASRLPLSQVDRYGLGLPGCLACITFRFSSESDMPTQSTPSRADRRDPKSPLPSRGHGSVQLGMTPLPDVPRRVFLDTCVVNFMLDHGEQIYDAGSITADANHRVAQDIESMSDIMFAGKRAMWQLAISPHTYQEIAATRDGGRRHRLDSWFEDRWQYWLGIIHENATFRAPWKQKTPVFVCSGHSGRGNSRP